MKINTDNKQEAFKIIMKELGRKNLPRPIATKKLTHKEKGPYKRTGDAKDFLKQLVKSEEIPIDVEDSRLVRTDIRKAVV